MPSSELKTVIFDFGNVLAFFDPMIACRAFSNLSGGKLSPDDIARRVLSSDLEDRYETGRATTAEFIAEARTLLGIEAEDAAIRRAFEYDFRRNEAVCRAIPRIKSAGVRLVLGSNTNEIHYENFREPYADVLGCFDDLVLSYRAGARKPAAAFYEACLATTRCAPQECLYFDDRPDFIAAADRLGIPGVIYSPSVDMAQALGARGIKLGS